MKKTILASLPILAFAIALMNGNAASAFSNIYPDPNDSTSTADVVAVNGETRYVTRTDGTIRVWFPNNSGTVEVRSGNFCNGVRGDYSESEDSTYASWPNGANITRFNVIGTTQSFTGKKGVNCSASHTFSFNNIPETNKQNGYYYRDIDVTYVGSRRGPMNSYVIAAPGQPNVRIGLPGDRSGFQATQDQVDSVPANAQYRVPFGAPCSMTSPQDAELNFFDLDNAGGSGAQLNGPVTVRLKDTTTNSYVDFNGAVGSTWTPPSRNNTNQSIYFTARPDHKYRLEINNVYHNNTIQYSIPYAQIFSEPCPDATIVPKATVNGSATNISKPLGTSITFRNWATTSGVDSTGTDTFQLSVAVTSGTVPGGSWGPSDRRIAPARDVPDGRIITTFTPTATGVYCLETRIRDMPSYVQRPQGINKQICVTITAPPPPVPVTNTVEIIPNVADGPDIEPTETADISGSVEVKKFPGYKSWGYTEYSSQANPQSVPPTRYTYSVTGTDIGDATRGSCTQTNSSGTCIQWQYSCSGTNVGNFSSAPTCYRYNCTTYTRYGINTSFTCQDRWRCPAPANTAYRYTLSAPDCDVWQCPQKSPYVSTAPSKTDCDYRCQNGTGDMAYNGSLTSASPCYQRPSFTLTCTWDDDESTTVTETVTPDKDIYCVSSVKVTGSTIGLRVCAALTPEKPTYPNDWSPSSPLPGWGNGGTDPSAPYSQREIWGWSVTPSSDDGCSRVVAKPTVKVLGGDVAVGGYFKDNCITGPQSSIVAWPHGPTAFDASHTEYAAYASNQIYGFATAAVRSNSETQPPGSLAFANTVKSGERYGGSFGSMPCMEDYAQAKPPDTTNSGAFGGPWIDQDGSYDYNPSQITGTATKTVKKGTQIVLYHQGNLHISSNILYERSGWATLADIPAIKVVVIAGNITIDPGVTELNGVYVAQPVGGIGGNIYTCATQAGPIANSMLYNSCRTKLTVNGAFVAKQVLLGRTGGGSGSEAGTAIRGQTSEEFRYLPEVWLAQWPRDNTNTTIKYDAMTNLPPIL